LTFARSGGGGGQANVILGGANIASATSYGGYGGNSNGPGFQGGEGGSAYSSADAQTELLAQSPSASALAVGGNQPDSIYVQGRYAYIAEGGAKTNAFEIYDISNPASPNRVSQSNLART